MNNTFDTDVDNYTDEELLEIIGLGNIENKEIIKVTRNKKIKVNFFFDKSTRLIECGCGGEDPHNEDLLFNPRLPS